MTTNPTAVLRSIARTLAVIVSLLATPVALTAQTGIVVRGVANYGLDGWSGDMRLAHATFNVLNNTTQSTTVSLSGETYLESGYYNEFGEWVNGPPMGPTQSAVTIGAGQTVQVTFRLALLDFDQASDIGLNISSAAGLPTYSGRARVVGSYYYLDVSFYGETATPTFAPKPLVKTVTATTTSAWLDLWNHGDAYTTATYALSTNCASLGVNCSVPATVQVNPNSRTTFNLTFARGSFTSALPTFKVYATAPFNRFGVAERDSVSVTITYGDVVAPWVWIEPADAIDPGTGEASPYVATSRNAPIYVNACDSDGVLATPTLTLNGVAMTATTVAAGPSWCAISKRATYVLPFAVGSNTVVAAATDGVHTTTATSTVIYDDAADHAAVITPLHATSTVPINRMVTDTFIVRNPGWHVARYASLQSSFCAWENPTGGYCGGLTVRDTITLNPGATVQIPITYGSATTQGRSERVTLRAGYTGSLGTTVFATGAFVATSAPMIAPTVTVSPLNGAVVATSNPSVTVTWCDDDDLVVQRTLTMNGQDLGSGTDIGPAPTAGCAHEQRRRWTNLALNPWQQNALVATGVDQQGHSTTITSTIAFAPAIESFQPEVTPASIPIRSVRPGITTADTFLVRNAGQYAATYALVTSCKGSSSCTLDRSAITLAPNGTGSVVMTYITPSVADVRDTVSLIARYSAPSGFSGTVADTAIAASISPSIETTPAIGTPIGSAVLIPTWIGMWSFPITNRNTAPVTYSLNWTTTGGFGFPDWSAPPASVTIDAGQSALVQTFSKAPTGDGVHGTYTLVASYISTTGATVSASRTADIVTQVSKPAMVVAPRNTTLPANPGVINQVAFSVTSSGNTTVIAIPSVSCTGLVLNCRFHASPQYNDDIAPTATATILVDFDLRPSDAVGTLSLVVVDGQVFGAPPDTATVTIRRDGPYVALSVSPKTSLTYGTNRTVSQQFDITNTGNTAATVSLSMRCSGQAVACVPRDTSRLLGAAETASVTVNASTAASASLTGFISVVATANAPNLALDTGRVAVTTGAIAEVSVDARAVNSGTTIARDACLTIAAGDAAAYECGDLRLAHSLPATTTMNKSRAPVLVYESRHQSGLTLFGANIRVAPGDTAKALVAHVTIDGGPRVDRTFAWDPRWNTGNARRIVVPVDAYALGIATGAHRYTFAVDLQSAQTSVPGQDTGTVAIINRATSEFGAGWWLDGLEQLVPFTATEKLWIGGDGSTRLYTLQPSGTWRVTPTADRVDTMTTDGTSWYRWLPNRGYVQFNNAGQHIATMNAAGHRTSFVYGGPGGRLSRIDLPLPAGSATQLSYNFNYGASGVLESVDSPQGSEGSRHVAITHVGTSKISGIYNPGIGIGDSVRFGYDVSGRIASRTNRRGDPTYYRFDQATQVLLGDSIVMQRTNEPPIVATFCPAEAASLATCALGPRDTAVVMSWFDGPRVGVNDTTRFYLNRFGAPERVVNAIGQTTIIKHSNATWPLLATAVTSSNGHTVESTYDARGLVASTLDRNPTGDAHDVITQYEWSGSFEKPTAVSFPCAVEAVPCPVQSRFGYFPNGDRQWQEDGRGQLSRVWFEYNGNRQLAAILSPDNQASQAKDRYDYDALGNLSRTTTAMGIVTEVQRDVLGREERITTATQQSVFTYDRFDQLTTSRTTELATPGNALTVGNEYDAEGNAITVTRTVDPDPLHLSAIVLKSEFDAAGRKIREYDPNRTQTGRWGYDAAGNVLTAVRGTSATTTAEYDALGRMTRRIVPNVTYATTNTATNRLATLVDTQRFTYDSQTGSLESAWNFAARVGRTYFPNGSLASETMRIASADLLESDATRFSHHTYTVSYTYDRAGRRKTMTPPPGFGLSLVMYDYDVGSGALQRVSDATFGAFRYAYTNGGLLDSLIQADGTRERHRYDDDGREIGRTEWSPVAGMLHNDDAVLDPRGKKLIVGSAGPFGNDGATHTYDGLGGVTSVTGRTTESTPRDALGNALSRTRSGEPYSELYAYIPHTTQLKWITQRLDEGGTVDSLEQFHDATGDVVHSIETVTARAMCLSGGGNYEPCLGDFAPRRTVASSELKNYYDDAGRLTLSVKATTNDNSGLWTLPRGPNDVQVYPKFERGVAEEYRHDALGRRVLVRARRNYACPGLNDRDSTTVCISTIERSVYDGDQVLVEIRQPGDDDASAATLEADGPAAGTPAQHFGTVGYLHGPTIDHPLALVRNYDGTPVPVVLHYQWMHGLDVSTRLDGRVMSPCSTLPCAGDNPDWAGRRMTYGFVIPSSSTGPVSWWGTMANMKQNATGGMDMRNRVYDSRSGRFTQEDPIGLAGGMNLYGFANGDAVNYADPFGLCPPGYVESPTGTCYNEAAMLGMAISGALETAEIGLATLRATMAARFAGANRIVVIGKMSELEELGAGEGKLNLPNRGVPKLNWEQNAGRLREAMNRGKPIRDAHVDPRTGALLSARKADGSASFLEAERGLLIDRGWTYSSQSRMWSPPAK